MQRRTFLAGGTASVAALACPALAREDAAVLRFVPQGGLTSADPIWSNTEVARNHGLMVWDTLYGQDQRGRPSPQMVSGHELSDDRLTWLFTLRDDLLFHDGERVRAQDCVPSVRRWAARRGFGRALLARLAEMRAVDDRRFEIRLTRPFPPMLQALASDTCFMMPERIARTSPFRPITAYIGSGPFRFLADEWVAGSSAAYARWDKYVPVEAPPEFTAGGKLARFERVEWRTVPDPAVASAALAEGRVDWWESPLIDLLPALRDAEGVHVLQNDRLGVQAMIALNHLHPPFDNPRLLRALLVAADQGEFMQAAMGSEPELYHLPCGVFTPGRPMASDAGIEVLTDPRDIAQAQRLITESGYRGERVVLMAPTDYPAIEALAQVARDLFQRVGLTVDYVGMDWATLRQRRANRAPADKGGWSAFCTTYDGLSLATPASHAPLRGNGLDGWFGWLTNARLETLREAWFDAPDKAAQKKVCAEMQLEAWETVPYIPLGQWFNPMALRKSVVDVVAAPCPVFWGARRET